MIEQESSGFFHSSANSNTVDQVNGAENITSSKRSESEEGSRKAQSKLEVDSGEEHLIVDGSSRSAKSLASDKPVRTLNRFLKKDVERFREAILKYGKNWTKVAEYVGGKTADACKHRARYIYAYHKKHPNEKTDDSILITVLAPTRPWKKEE